jgi:hypothetical protein
MYVSDPDDVLCRYPDRKNTAVRRFMLEVWVDTVKTTVAIFPYLRR